VIGESTPAVPASPSAHRIDADAGRFYDSVLEPSSPKRLPLGEGEWHQISRSYKWARLISLGAVLAVVVIAAIVGGLLLDAAWPWIAGAVLFVWYGWSAAITPRQARAYAYQLRDDDLVFRRGILWQRQVAVPYGRMQLVDITHGPLDRAFGIAQLKLVTAAASTGVTIPGLTQAAAEQLRDTLVEVAESRRTGL
jgi:membrane protein YdbS with pleckstrin-like domain